LLSVVCGTVHCDGCVVQGVKMLWKLKQLLNPAQVFDLMTGGPKTGYDRPTSFAHVAT